MHSCDFNAINLFSASLILAPTTARFWSTSYMCNRALCKNDSHSFTCVWMGVIFVLDCARFNAARNPSLRDLCATLNLKCMFDLRHTIARLGLFRSNCGESCRIHFNKIVWLGIRT